MATTTSRLRGSSRGTGGGTHAPRADSAPAQASEVGQESGLSDFLTAWRLAVSSCSGRPA